MSQIIDNETLPVNAENKIDYISEDHDDCIFLDKDDPITQYTIVPNSLIRDANISPNCRWLIIFLLTNKPGWVIQSKQLANHTKGFIGRDAIRNILKEAIEAGYIKREDALRGNLRKCKYTVASSPKFKKCFRHPEFQGPEIQEPENQGPENTGDKELLSEEVLSLKTKTSIKVSEPQENQSPDGSGGLAKIPKSKPKKEAPDFSPRVREMGNQMINLLLKHNPVYRPPQDLTKFLWHVQELLEKEGQDPKVLLRTFEYAISDNEERGTFKGWGSIIVTNNKGGKVTNPAEIFRKYFSKIYSQMNAAPKRKFAPSSDQNRALELMEEMTARAIR